MRLLYLLLLLAMVSCKHRTTKEDKAPGTESESMTVDTVINDTSMRSLVEIKVEVGVPDIESMKVRIVNQCKEIITVCDSYSISALESGECKLLFDKKLATPLPIPAGEERVLTINLELDKIRYSKNTEYKFSTCYRFRDSEGGGVSDVFCLFRTPEMWKEGKSVTLMPDTMIDHCR